jgi:putative ABC transport system substrate-binding protein
LSYSAGDTVVLRSSASVLHEPWPSCTCQSRPVAAFARQGNGGLIVTSSGRSIQYRDFIIAQASQHGLPAVYCASAFVKRGGLISYGPNRVEQFQRAAAYISRILNGEKPANLPVQAPTKYELVVNFKAAKALGLEIPSSVLARADEVEAPCL